LTYVFTGDNDAVMASILRNARTATADRPDADGYLRNALIGLVGLYDRQAEYGPIDPDVMARFREESGEAFARVPGPIRAFAWTAQDVAEQEEEGDWYEVSMRRSALQSLRDDYAGTPAAGVTEEEDIDELDEVLRRVGPNQAPVPPEFVPRGLPEHHWWWSLPE
jgi:hypothetical protein